MDVTYSFVNTNLNSLVCEVNLSQIGKNCTCNKFGIHSPYWTSSPTSLQPRNDPLQRLWVIWGQCCPRVAAASSLINGPITQLSPYFTWKPGILFCKEPLSVKIGNPCIFPHNVNDMVLARGQIPDECLTDWASINRTRTEEETTCGKSQSAVAASLKFTSMIQSTIQ